MKNFCLPENYRINPNPHHYSDFYETDTYQREVYTYARSIMKSHRFKDVVDVGCGSAYKLLKYLDEFNTIGIETEPCISFLRHTYPQHKWLDSGEPEKSFKFHELTTDLVICSDVIEHILDPDQLVKFLLSINAKYYIISTPCRDKFVEMNKWDPNGPPANWSHVREWNMDEFKRYISQYFTLIDSHYAERQIECQIHLLIKKDPTQ